MVIALMPKRGGAGGTSNEQRAEGGQTGANDGHADVNTGPELGLREGYVLATRLIAVGDAQHASDNNAV